MFFFEPDQVVITVTPPIIVKSFPSDTVVFAGDKFQLLATSGATNYSWGPTAGLSNPLFQILFLLLLQMLHLILLLQLQPDAGVTEQ
jgi:hypothetical protein